MSTYCSHGVPTEQRCRRCSDEAMERVEAASVAAQLRLHARRKSGTQSTAKAVPLDLLDRAIAIAERAAK